MQLTEPTRPEAAAGNRPRFTAKGLATRQRIIEGAADEVREQGVPATRLEDVLSRTSTSKSQLFHYFPGGKDDLLLAVAEYEADRVLADQQPYLGDLTSWPQWTAWREAVLARYREQGTACPLGTLISHLGRATPGTRAITARLLADWQGHIARGVRAMQEQGEISALVDADEASAALLAGIQGGVTILMSTGSLTHLQAALDFTVSGLRLARSTEFRAGVPARSPSSTPAAARRRS